MGELDFSDLEIRMLGEDSALVLGKWHLTRSGGTLAVCLLWFSGTSRRAGESFTTTLAHKKAEIERHAQTTESSDPQIQ